jgi:hydroxymethylglutaryl-CoA reductase
VRSAKDLALLMAAVGLAQNFAALRALAGSGIQQGHMKLHARSVVAAVGASGGHFDEVVSRLVRDGEIKRWRAEQILDEIVAASATAREPDGSAAGKVILFGEHAVVYGRHAVALPLPDAVHVYAEPARAKTTLSIPAWGIAGEIDIDSPNGVGAAVTLILRRLELNDSNFSLRVESTLPRAMGLGSSAAIAVAVTRAISSVAGLTLDDDGVNAIAFDCEKLAHGTPSGVDNTISTYARPIVFCNDGQLRVQILTLSEPPPIVIACSHEAGLTSVEVAGVRERYNRAPQQYERLFDEMDQLGLAGADLLKAQKYEELGLLMNICHGLLSAIEVSTPELDSMVSVARQAGAAGAKLTGAGGGGSIVAICPDNAERVRDALEQAGYPTLLPGR